MKKSFQFITLFPCFLLCSLLLYAQPVRICTDELDCKLYPEVNDNRPELASPFISTDLQEYVVAITKHNKYAIIPVTVRNDRDICRPQLYVDTMDFPALASTGLHDQDELKRITFITGWSLDHITELGRPGGLSNAGFMAADEDVLSVIKGDDIIVRMLGLTHPQLAKPLWHVLNLMDEDLALNRWNMARHQWEHITSFYYNKVQVMVEAYDTKGGQRSIFDDGIQGAFHIKLWRDLSKNEYSFLKNTYKHLSEDDFKMMVQKLSFINTGEIQPQYIMRYGFYEGHTFWRADPITIAFIFGLKDLVDIHESLDGDLFGHLTEHFVN